MGARLPKAKLSLQQRKDNRSGFLFALPWIIGFICFSVYPMLASLYYSFTQFNAMQTPQWVGLDNYISIFQDNLAGKALKNTLFMAFVGTPVNLIVALLLGALCTKNFRGRSAARTIFFLPSVIPMVVGTMVWIWMFDPTYGYINEFLSWFGVPKKAWLLNPAYTKWALVLMGTWSVGITMLIMMAALQDVPSSYYEAAQLDGANSLQRFRYITLPGIAHVLVYQAILGIINAFQYFQQVYIIINASSGTGTNVASGGPANSILMYPLYIFHNAFVYFNMGKASALAWIMFVAVALLTVIMTRLSKKVTEATGSE